VEPVTTLPAGATVFDAHLRSRNLFLLRAGQVQLWSGDDAVIGHLTPGDFFGQQSLLRGAAGNQAARTLTLVKLSVFGTGELLDRLQKDRRFAAHFARNMARRMERLETTIADFIAVPAELRLARTLLRWAPARSASEWVRLQFNPSNAVLAKMVGTTRWRIAHFMSRFQRFGWLRRRPDLWVRREGLQAFLASADLGGKTDG
jgi:CRP-like cAMP-binding protein